MIEFFVLVGVWAGVGLLWNISLTVQRIHRKQCSAGSSDNAEAIDRLEASAAKTTSALEKGVK